MCDPPVALARLGVAHGCGCDGGGGTGRREPTGVRRISHRSGLIALLSSATGVGGQRSAHQGSKTSNDDVLGGRRRGLAAALGGARGGGCWRGAPGSETPWIDSVEACGKDTGVRAIQGAATASNYHGDTSHRRRSWVEFRCRRGSVRGKGTQRRLQVLRRSFCGGRWRPR